LLANHRRPIKKEKPSKQKSKKNWKNRLCPNPSTTPPPSIQARPALRAPRLGPRATPACGTTPEAGNRKERKRHPQAPNPRKPDIRNISTRACLPKDSAGNFLAEQERSDVVHDLLAFLAERMLEMNKQKQQMINGLRKKFTTLLSRRIAVFLPGISSETVLLERRCWVIFT
jgi:hypothetical protein